ncbi:tail fiber assembly protein [Cronobacter malonaticus]|uniref:tail fiber assembly protein n=2 Tax=Cronobacter malonaticus TaxID=413503 RepID=UPI000517E77E|nr:tail fiber assembly protein [Cronobacter malonaticus]EGT4373099.1 tail fiber assembly protein [Cronobacter malonaticus]MDI6469758.1 tail fiber assembly protein [Cronobacter malonaticus]NCH00353.1 tail fiber assembly protein [Cronobacter malonaticus]NCH32102.1 tail fiber assembly protein [Cronobacter malonaticus]NCH50654.1 tail fiber assembly protein [Cronobacter malonaticus]
MVDIYGVIVDGVVVNSIMWDGEGQLDMEGDIVLMGSNGGIGWTYDGKKFIPPVPPEKTHEEYVAIAENQRRGLSAAAEQSISLLQTKLLMGRKLTQEETSKVNKALDYIDALNSLDISKAPNIEWPDDI